MKHRKNKGKKVSQTTTPSSNMNTMNTSKQRGQKKKWKTSYTLIIFAVVVVAMFFIFFQKPEYDNIITPKPILGNPEANIKIVEFTDFQCPYCAQAHFEVKQIVDAYGDNISFEIRHFPLTSIHPNAQKAAEAAECANDQGSMWEYIDLLYTNQDKLQLRHLKEYAQQVGLDSELFDACLDSGSKRAFVQNDVSEGNSLGVRGTPSFFLNGNAVQDYRFTAMSQEIERLLALQ